MSQGKKWERGELLRGTRWFAVGFLLPLYPAGSSRSPTIGASLPSTQEEAPEAHYWCSPPFYPGGSSRRPTMGASLYPGGSSMRPTIDASLSSTQEEWKYHSKNVNTLTDTNFVKLLSWFLTWWIIFKSYLYDGIVLYDHKTFYIDLYVWSILIGSKNLVLFDLICWPKPKLQFFFRVLELNRCQSLRCSKNYNNYRDYWDCPALFVAEIGISVYYFT